MQFSSLIAPLTQAELDSHWNRASLLLPRRTTRFAELAFDLEALCRELLLTSTPVRAQYLDAHGDHCEMSIQPSQLKSCVAAGLTVCVVEVDAFLPALAAQSRALRDSLRFAGTMNFSLYWSSGGAGFGLHYDNHAVFICHLAGRKRWWYSAAPAVREPRNNCVYSAERVAALRAGGVEVEEPGALEECVLEPGDMLYLPPGTWHKTCAVDGESQALTLRLFEGTVEHVVHHSLQSWMATDANWRRLLPLAEPGVALSGAIEQAFADQLAKLKQFVNGLTAIDLARTWTELQAHTTAAAHQHELAPGDRVGVRPHVRILRAPNPSGEDCFFVYTGAEEIELPVAHNAWLDWVIANKEFNASDACSWANPSLSWSEAKRILDELVADGIVSVLPPR